MKYFGYKLLLGVLSLLVYGKRVVTWVWSFISPAFGTLVAWYNKSIGFWLYKVYFLAKRRIQKWSVPWEREFLFVLGKRSTLQAILLVLSLAIMFPHTKFFSKETVTVPGRNTLLYTLVGPGDQNFDIEEISFNALAPKANQPSWSEGALVQQQPSSGQPIAYEPSDVSGIGAGGQAFVKPTIIGGGQASVSQPVVSGDRIAVVIHEVQPGEVIGKIAQYYDISVETILWANNLTSRSYIRPGDKLKILPVTGVTHKIAKGDTIAKIAKKYGAKEEEIIRVNKLKASGTDIVIGEELIIPGGRRQQTVPSLPARIATPLKNIVAPQPSVEAPAGSGYVWPAGVRRITQYFGLRHTGVDIAGPIGTPLYAARAGTVIRSQCGWNGGYGCYVILDHGGGVTTLYGHASKLLVDVGDQVEQGHVLALMGSTGRSTGPHIHFEVRVNGARQNPLKYVR